MTADATVVICTRDRPNHLAQTLPTVIASAQAARADVVVVEQGDSNASKFAPEVTVLRDNGHGASRARNIGIAHARGVVLFTDDDCEVDPKWVIAMVDRLRTTNASMALGTVTGMSSGAGLPVDARRVRPWFMGHSANLAATQAAFARVGGFDERLGAGVWTRGGEDADLIVRFLDAGEQVEFDVEPPVRHTEWRDEAASDVLSLSYERGAGAWLGRAIRRRGRAARPYVAARAGFVREVSAQAWRETHRPDRALAPIAQLMTGLAVGLATAPRTAIPPRSP